MSETALPQTTSAVADTVLDFYRTLPFNMRESAEAEAEAMRASNVVTSYPGLGEHLGPGVRTAEIGCGTGWLSNSMALHYGATVTGVDFNPVAVEHARKVAALLDLGAQFVASDLYRFEPQAPFQVVVSNGVLHHTHDCLEGLERVFTRFLAPGGVAMIGLYHLHGRKPFLDHFKAMRQAGASEEAMLDRYAELHPQLAQDRKHLLSWYRDQVCHPHETQHTMAEIFPLLDRTGMTLLSTSVNRFGRADDRAAIAQAELGLEATGRQRLEQNVYFPGFFLFLARKTGGSAA